MNSDHILFEQWQQGDERAYDELFRTYYKKLCFAAIKTTTNLPDAEDIVQELFIEIYNAASNSGAAFFIIRCFLAYSL